MNWSQPYQEVRFQHEHQVHEGNHLQIRYTHSIITYNVSNFGKFKAFCWSQSTRVDFASVAHPRTNGQVERANGMILQGLKPRLMMDLEHAAGAWVSELPFVLWGLWTTPNRSTKFTPFFMVYGGEAIMLSDLLHSSTWVQLYVEAKAKVAHQDGLNLLEEECELALTRSTIYQQNMCWYHSWQVWGRAFNEGDLVLRLDRQKEHKLAPSWEGSFINSKMLKWCLSMV